MQHPIRVMTWNVHGCVGTDRKRDPARIAAAIGDLSPDIVALQEVDLRDVHADPVSFLDLVAGEAEMHRFEAFTIEEPGRRYGNVLISRWPIEKAAAVDLAYRRREPRLAIDAVVRTPVGRLRIIATHFGLSAAEREEQIRRLASCLGETIAGPTLVLGDFNDWRWPGSVGRRFSERLPVCAAPKSFPSRFPLFCLDRIFATEGIELSLLPPAEPRRASDHLSVTADVLIKIQKIEYEEIPA